MLCRIFHYFSRTVSAQHIVVLKFRLARLRAHFFCLNERGAEPAGGDEVIRIMFWLPFFSLVLLAKERKYVGRHKRGRNLPVQIYALQFAPGTNPAILTAAKNPTNGRGEHRAAPATPTNRERLSWGEPS